jgi:uracil-DNA glycosylase
VKSIDPQIEEGWKEILMDEFQAPYFSGLKDFLVAERQLHKVFPQGNLIFNAFRHTPFHNVKVVILGQDPYHGEGQAHGLCFSVPPGIQKPPSLVNIFKELNTDLGIPIPDHGSLVNWADQGVLLLNATLTVRASQAGSHQNRGWENFTNSVIKKVSLHKSGVVFILWGRYAQMKEALVDRKKHMILKSVHPSPLSAYNGFFGSKPFSQTNDYLQQQGLESINWSLS